ncbi:hypothetical protein IWW45_009155, partial [Coemansia sp. RSA 485]
PPGPSQSSPGPCALRTSRNAGRQAADRKHRVYCQPWMRQQSPRPPGRYSPMKAQAQAQAQRKKRKTMASSEACEWERAAPERTKAASSACSRQRCGSNKQSVQAWLAERAAVARAALACVRIGR